MNNKAIMLLKNFSYTVSSNLLSMIISIILILLVPKLVGVKDYGYWQLYIFYSSYVGFLHFGWNDGIYLRYGGKEYKSLNKTVFFSQFWMLVLFQYLLAICIFIITMFIKNIDPGKVFILRITSLCMVIVNIRCFLIYVLQCTNRIKEYAYIILIEKILYCITIIILLFSGYKDFKFMIICDLIAKLISLLFSAYFCKEFVFKKITLFYFGFKEAFENINVGSKLMFSNIAGMLIIGLVRFGIQKQWDVTTFGKVSLTLSISNFLMIFVNAIGIILFPIIKRTDSKKSKDIYSSLRTFLVVILLLLLTTYYPIKEVLSAWIPKYSESLKYMALLFPICLFEGKMALLINTYLKAYRKEKVILKVNLATLILSAILTYLFVEVMNDLVLSITSIVVLLAFRCIIAELFLSRILKIYYLKETLLEIFLTLSFIVTGWYTETLVGFIIYLAIYIVYLLYQSKEIKVTFKKVKLLISN